MGWVDGHQYYGSQGEVEQLTLIVDYQMQFEAKEPINRGFPSCGYVLKDLVLLDAAIMADLKAGGIQETDATTSVSIVQAASEKVQMLHNAQV